MKNQSPSPLTRCWKWNACSTKFSGKWNISPFWGFPFKQSSLFRPRLIKQMITWINRNIKTQQQWISQQWITHLSSFIFVLGKSSQLFPNKLQIETSTVCWIPSDTMWILNHNMAHRPIHLWQSNSLVVASDQCSWCLCWNLCGFKITPLEI